MILLLLYIDEIIITDSSSELIANIITRLGKEFTMKDIRPLHFFLRVDVRYFKDGIHLNQGKYVIELLMKTDMALAKAISTPLEQKHGLQQVTGNSIDVSTYSRIVGSLQYLTITRPDISHTVNLVSQFMQTPNTKHLQAVKRILIYVKDWGGCATTRRSTSRYTIYLGANCISWASKKQHRVSRSSAEAEYRGLASTAAKIIWITYILRDIVFYLKTAPTMFFDNISALYMIVNPVLHDRTKHVEMDYHIAREKVARGHLVTRCHDPGIHPRCNLAYLTPKGSHTSPYHITT
ncbi:uncharacterized mitochondrial protein AtMg00810-like [Solanum stenotomum]|uniref:uncharacterized mitochondrial protein AtMg00810-like n=1 Tax=Solanum stenotomum TaxID=172797 RepID=UPI0020D1EC7A|nr:uncharacterized mitochondrial protein AtMg00810-like [Solanum stenotomum]